MTRPNFIVSSRFLAEEADSFDLLDINPVQNFSFDLADQLSAALEGATGAALNREPTQISARQITWGNTTDGVTLTGSGLSQINNAEQLAERLEMGIASGSFDALTFFGGGQTLASLNFGAAGFSFSSGAQSLSFGGTIPNTFQGLFDLLGGLSELGDEPDLDALASTLSALDIDNFVLRDGDDTLVEANFGASVISLDVNGIVLQATGTFPANSVGALVALIDDVVSAEENGTEITSLTQINGLAINTFSLTDSDGTVLFRTDGPIEELDTPFDTVRIEGTDTADRGIFVGFGGDEALRVVADLGAGDDSVLLDTFFDDLAPTSIDGGAGFDRLVVDDFNSDVVQVDMAAGTVTGLGSSAMSPPGVSDLERYSATFSNFEAIELSFGQRGVVLGQDTDETVSVVDAFGRAEFYGGGGIDTFDFSRIETLDQSGFGTGLEIEDAQNFTATYGHNSTLVLRNDAFFSEIYLSDVEQVSYKAGRGTTTTTVQDLLDSADSGITLGTSGDDGLAGGDGAQTVLGQSGDDFLYGDGLAVDAFAAQSEQVFRIYQATLGRTPDQAGHEGFVRNLFEDTFDIGDIAGIFVGSREFRNTYGNLEDTDFVELLYQNVLGRASDADGLQGWLNVLEGGGARADVVLGFSDSREFVNATLADARAYTAASTEANWTDEVYRIYRATLDRDADQGGLLNWTGELSEGTALVDVVAGFTNSREFQNTYGELDDAAFVELLYGNVLNRASDAGGLQNWLDVLENGGVRADVVLGFSESQEFITGTASDVDQWVRDQGVQDVIDGGSGTTQMFGGILADAFVFSAQQGGTHTVYDLENWDELWFDNFGYTGLEDVTANMTQQGADVVFEDQGVTVTLRNVELDSGSADIRLFEDAVEVLL